VNGSEVSLLGAFIAGVVSFVSPCVLPVIPVYIAMLAGAGDATVAADRRLVFHSICFMAGFTVVFLLMGATASLLGQLFADYQQVIRKAGGLFMVVMGLCLAGVIRIPTLQRDWRPLPKGPVKGPLGAMLLGMAITAGWTPCIGPILASLLTYAGIDNTLEQGLFLLVAYSAGFAVPFLLFTLLCNRYLTRIRTWYRWLPLIQKTAGLVLAFTGVLLYFNLVQKGLGIILDWWQ
jgi:cytochrome c-type biogenesis protein